MAGPKDRVSDAGLAKAGERLGLQSNGAVKGDAREKDRPPPRQCCAVAAARFRSAARISGRRRSNSAGLPMATNGGQGGQRLAELRNSAVSASGWLARQDTESVRGMRDG